MKIIFCILLVLTALTSAFAQDLSNRQLKIKKVHGEITLDGILNEKDWLEAAIASDFFQNFPADTSFATTKTEVKMTFDDSPFIF